MADIYDRRVTLLAGRGHRIFEVLAVCTANLCRSPVVEAQLRADLDRLPGAWSVGSAGVRARIGLPVHPDSARALAERDLALPAGWRTRRLSAEQIARADIVLTATREHRGVVIGMVPRAATRVFTLHQFARLLGAAPIAHLPGDDDGHPGDVMLRSAVAARGLGTPAHPDDDDLDDPIGRQFRAFRALAETVAVSSTEITSSLLIAR